MFPYSEEERAQGSGFIRQPLMRPVVVVRLAGARMGDHNLAALVDSGSDHVLAAPWIAQDIGVTPDPEREIRLGIGGATRQVRFADVTMHLLPPEVSLSEGGRVSDVSYSWNLQVGFFTAWEAPPWNVVLGQVGFFDQFTVTLNRFSQALAFTDVGDFDDLFPQPAASAEDKSI